MAKTNEIILKVHGCNFIRTGKCNRCGICCMDDKCPHFKWIDGVATCLIYDKRAEECEECKKRLGKEGKSFTHQVCIDFPNHPFLKVIHKKECSYTFKPLTKEDEDKVGKLDIRYADGNSS